jgi:hypothetical protein
MVPRLETALTKEEGFHPDLQENYRTGDHEVNCQIFCWAAKDQRLDIVEGLTPSKMDKEIVHGVRAGNVGAPSTQDILSPLLQKKHFGWCCCTWINWNLIREPHGISTLKEGALGAVGK